MYTAIDPKKLLAAITLLEKRISERFPGSGLSKVVGELRAVGAAAEERAAWISRPHLLLRSLLALTLAALAAVLWNVLSGLHMEWRVEEAGQFVQVLESAFNSVVLIGAAIFSLVTLETRLKRSRALAALHELRVLAHIVDAHQLTKDPQVIVAGYGVDTASSPQRTMSRLELSRYLDYCTEMLSLISKVAALYAQNFRDPVALDAVDALENLTSGLSAKIWQKVMLLHAER